MYIKSQIFLNILNLKQKVCLGPANWILIYVLTEYFFNLTHFISSFQFKGEK